MRFGLKSGTHAPGLHGAGWQSAIQIRLLSFSKQKVAEIGSYLLLIHVEYAFKSSFSFTLELLSALL